MLRDYYKKTRKCIDEYNRITDKIKNSPEVTTNEEDEFMDNHYKYLVDALIDDIHDDVFLRQMSDAIKEHGI